MQTVTDSDRKAAEELRAMLGDMSGFWFPPGDTSPICAALARHRAKAEAQLLETIHRTAIGLASTKRAIPGNDEVGPEAFEARTPRSRPAAVGR